MAQQTIAQRVINEMAANGYKLAGQTTGWLSFRKRTNLSHEIERLGLDPNQVRVREGAKLQRQSQGTQLLIFVKS
jgi:hypothetical protein